MDRPLFLYGTLRDEEILRLALGPHRERVQLRPARLAGHTTRAAGGGAYPVLRPDPRQDAPGLLLSPGDREVRRALDHFEGAFDYTLVDCEVETDDGPVAALVYRPVTEVVDDETPWRLEEWVETLKPLFLAAAQEVATHSLPPSARSGVLRRAGQRVAAHAPSPQGRLRSAMPPEAVEMCRTERLFTGFFACDAIHYRHALFGGGMSAEVRREVFMTGDAVTVLPWDPVLDRVLLIEQVRAGILGRGEANPWNLEVIAGLVDAGETPEETARREAQEEAGVEILRLHQICAYYPTPGAVTEFVTGYIGECDLSGIEGGIHGLDHEHEDIRTLVVSREEAVASLETGEARNAPLIVSLMALDTRHGRLLADWVGGVAGGGGAG